MLPLAKVLKQPLQLLPLPQNDLQQFEQYQTDYIKQLRALLSQVAVLVSSLVSSRDSQPVQTQQLINFLQQYPYHAPQDSEIVMAYAVVRVSTYDRCIKSTIETQAFLGWAKQQLGETKFTMLAMQEPPVP